MRSAIVGLGLSLVIGLSPAAADSYPSRNITMVVPFPAGGGVDTVARPLAEGLRRNLKQPVLIENRGGAATNIGTEYVAKSAPDGYTLLINLDIISVYPHLYKNLRYDVFNDLKPISYVAVAPMVIAVHPSVSVNSIKELVKLARERPDDLNFAIPGIGTPHHLAFELLSQRAGIRIKTVAYKGGAPALNDVLGGHVQIGVFTLGTVIPYIETGKMKALALTGFTRAKAVPMIPTIAEAGYPGAEIMNRYVVMAPAKTPSDVTDTLHRAIEASMREPEMSTLIQQQSFDELLTGPTKASELMLEEFRRWGPLLDNVKVVSE